jgi:hypothetical protein
MAINGLEKIHVRNLPAECDHIKTEMGGHGSEISYEWWQRKTDGKQFMFINFGLNAYAQEVTE